MIYLDNAATTLYKPPEVAKAVYNAINTMGNASRGSYGASLEAEHIIFQTREKLKKLFNLESPNSVAFTSNATEALNTAIKGVLKSGFHVITTPLEHNSVLRPLYEMENNGVELSIIEADKKGSIDYNDIERNILYNTKVLICTHASNVTGNVLDISVLGDICKRHKLIFILDASQTAGVFPIDMQKNNIGIICFTGHKSLMAPQGTGGICVRSDITVDPLKTGGSGIKSYLKSHPSDMPTALEAGTPNSHSIAGLNASLEYIENIGIDNIRKKEENLMRMFYEIVRDISGVKIYGDFSTYERSPIVALNILDYDSSIISNRLSSVYDIAVRPGAHCAPLMHQVFGTEKQGIVRFSFSYFNTEKEVNLSLDAIKQIVC